MITAIGSTTFIMDLRKEMISWQKPWKSGLIQEDLSLNGYTVSGLKGLLCRCWRFGDKKSNKCPNLVSSGVKVEECTLNWRIMRTLQDASGLPFISLLNMEIPFSKSLGFYWLKASSDRFTNSRRYILL